MLVVFSFGFYSLAFFPWRFSSLLFSTFLWFADFVLAVLGGDFVRGVGDLSFGLLVVDLSPLMVWAWMCPYSAALFLCLTLIVAMTFVLSYTIM